MINYEAKDYRAENLSIFDIAHIKDILEEPIKYDWFAAHILRLCRKSDLKNLAKLATIYPDIVAAFCYYKYKHIPEWVRDSMEFVEYYEYWIPRLMERVK